MRKLLAVIPVIAVAVSVVCTIMTSNDVSAIVYAPSATIGAQQYPLITSGSGKGTPAHASYVVSNDGGQTNIATTTINIYVPAGVPPPTVTLHNYNMCTSKAAQLGTTNSFDQSFGNTTKLDPSNYVVTTYSLTGGQTAQSVDGKWSNNCASATHDFTLSGGTLSSSTNYLQYRLTVTAASSLANAGNVGFINMFWLSGPDGVVFSQDSSQGARYFGYQLSSPIPKEGNKGTGTTHFQTAFPFGTACSVKAATDASISFYDLDTSDQTIQQGDVYAQLRDVTDGNAGQLLSQTSAQGILDQGTSTNQYRYRIQGDNGQTLTAKFTAKPGHRYILWLYNVFYNNTLQFKIPYDSIYYYATCHDAKLNGNTTLDNQLIMPGQAANWTHQMVNTDTVGSASSVNAIVNRTVTDTNGVVKSTTSTPLVTNATIGPNSKNPDPPTQDTFTATPADIGSTVCEWISWTWSGGSDDNKSSQYCTVVAKQPKVQILGGDLRVGGGIYTGSTLDTSAGKTYGSWGEYGVFINGNNDGDRFGSGASLRGGGNNDNPLTFSNTSSPTGQFGDLSLNAQDLTTVLKTSGLPTRCAANSLSAGGCTTASSVALSLNTATVPSGTTVYINAPNAIVTINGDIRYASRIASISQLPQVIIVAKSIIISSSVAQVDAWLLTPTGSGGGCPRTLPVSCALTTSNTAPASGDKQLFIHGPVATKDLSLPRGAGSDDVATQDKAAETFDLRADSYLWMYSQAAQNYSPQTAQVTNLPPRY